MTDDKRLAEVTARDVASDTSLQAYEIHIGRTTGKDCDRAWLTIDGRFEGAQSASGRVKGCYLHGLFASDAFRHSYLTPFGLDRPQDNFEAGIEDTLDALAQHMETHVDIDRLIELADEV
jgi:adenosylcobyric acid synthase